MVFVVEGDPTVAEEAAEDAAEHDLRYYQGGEGMGFPTG